MQINSLSSLLERKNEYNYWYCFNKLESKDSKHAFRRYSIKPLFLKQNTFFHRAQEMQTRNSVENAGGNPKDGEGNRETTRGYAYGERLPQVSVLGYAYPSACADDCAYHSIAVIEK